MPDVTFAREDYTYSMLDWGLVSDVCSGERGVKSSGVRYLPKPNPGDDSKDASDRYKQYLLRAVFYGVTSSTLTGLIGAAFRKAPVLSVPTGIDYVSADVDGGGVNIYQQSQKVVGQVLQKGRCGLLVDYPSLSSPVSMAEQATLGVRATISTVDAEQIVNWRTSQLGGVRKLSMVVISETSEEVSADGFGSDVVSQYRVLQLVDGVYVVSVWRKTDDNDNDNGDWIEIESHTPTDGAGRNWNEIPFLFVGSENNDPGIDRAPMLDIARLNLAHYRNSADHEDSVFFCGQPQPWISGLDVEWRDHLKKSGIYMGSRQIIPIPKNGALGIEQAAPNTLAKEAMDQKERQMVALGARLVERGTVAKTATESQNENAVQHSVLSLVVSNVSAAYTACLAWVSQYQNVSGDVGYSINREFIDQRLDPQMITALVGAWQSGKLPESDLWGYWRKHGLIDPSKSDEEIKGEIDASGSGLGLE